MLRLLAKLLKALASDLDRLLGEAVGREVQGQAKKLEARLRSAIGAQAAGPIAEATGGIGELGRLDGRLSDLLGRLTGLAGEAGRAAAGGTKVPGVKLPGKLKLPF